MPGARAPSSEAHPAGIHLEAQTLSTHSRPVVTARPCRSPTAAARDPASLSLRSARPPVRKEKNQLLHTSLLTTLIGAAAHG